jgi:hypothetical protein
MPTSLNEFWRRLPFLNNSHDQIGGRDWSDNDAKAKAERSFSLKLSFRRLTLTIEPRFFVILLFIIPLYALSAFVGNDWTYMLPCALVALLVIGVLFPLIQVCSIACTCRFPPHIATDIGHDVILKAWRLPFFGVLSRIVPTGYLNAHLHLAKKNWATSARTSEVVPLPVVLNALSRGLEVRLRVPNLKRGVYHAEDLEIASCFPFAIVWWSKKIPLEVHEDEQDTTLTVLPPLYEVAGNFHRRLSQAIFSSGRTANNSPLQTKSSNLKGVREFTERDSLNQIHWASSARAGKLLVREFELESLPDYDVVLNLGSSWNEKQFELACTAAYALMHYGPRRGFKPHLYLNPPLDWEPIAEHLSDIPAGLSGDDLAAGILARVSPLPKKLLNDYENFSKHEKRSRLAASRESASSGRALISIMPASNAKGAATILLSEESQIVDDDESALGSAGVSTLARIESEKELGRI